MHTFMKIKTTNLNLRLIIEILTNYQLKFLVTANSNFFFSRYFYSTMYFVYCDRLQGYSDQALHTIVLKLIGNLLVHRMRF
jgi:hypothetical protein